VKPGQLLGVTLGCSAAVIVFAMFVIHALISEITTVTTTFTTVYRPILVRACERERHADFRKVMSIRSSDHAWIVTCAQGAPIAVDLRTGGV
jgi:hypothetical protein